MRAFLAVVALLGLALSQQDLLPERNSDIDEVRKQAFFFGPRSGLFRSPSLL